MRGKSAPKRLLLPDPRYGKPDVAKFINFVMLGGKKSTAQRLVYGAFAQLEQQDKQPVDVFEKAVENVSPAMEVRSRRVGGANYQIPMPVRGERQRALAFRWLIRAAQTRKGQSMIKKLAQELSDAAEGLGDAVRKKQDVHKMAEANKAFAHFGRRKK